MNRVDYSIDFQNRRLDINPRDFIAHSRVKKSCHYKRSSVADHVKMRAEHV